MGWCRDCPDTFVLPAGHLSCLDRTLHGFVSDGAVTREGDDLEVIGTEYAASFVHDIEIHKREDHGSAVLAYCHLVVRDLVVRTIFRFRHGTPQCSVSVGSDVRLTRLQPVDVAERQSDAAGDVAPASHVVVADAVPTHRTIDELGEVRSRDDD